ncbi:MAG: acyltransferase family protein, partial [Faecalibacterium sp.]
LLKPYVFTALATTVLHFIIHYASFRYLPGTLGESIKVLGGFLLGLPHTAVYGGYTFFSCGPMWYLLALMVGWVLLDVVLNIFPEKYQPWAVLGVMLLGWGTCLVWELPFCLSQGMAIVPYLYIGFLAKKHRLFERPFALREWLALAAACVVVAAGAIVTRSTDCVSMAYWTMGPVSILLNGVVGYGLIALFLRWNQGQGAVVQALETVGRRSLFIFCIHTVELTAIPWYLLAARFSQHPAAGIALQYALSLASTLLVCELLVRRREWKARLLPAKRRKKARSPAPRH